MTSTNVRDDQLPRGSGDAAEVPPNPAASVLLLRDAPLEVLMIRRHARASFVPDTWVFPGGVAEESDAAAGDGSELGTMRVAALRELFEETGIWLGAPLSAADANRQALMAGNVAFEELIKEAPLDLEALVWTSRWITPVGVPKRFDTWFFLAAAERGVVAAVDQNEAVDVLWIAPADALDRHERGELPIVFPTIKNLESICGFSSAADLLASRRGVGVATTRPILVIEGGQKRIVLP